MVSSNRRVFILDVSVLVFVLLAFTAAAQEEQMPAYTLSGDLSEIRAKGVIRFLVHGEADYLPRNGDPKAAEQTLARELAQNLGLTPVFIPVAEQEDLLAGLNEGQGDVIVSSLAVTSRLLPTSTKSSPTCTRWGLSRSISRT
jgi:membrane-bound lytic murein transglycosylase MltF